MFFLHLNNAKVKRYTGPTMLLNMMLAAISYESLLQYMMYIKVKGKWRSSSLLSS